jgi:hypothetical protein
MRCHVQASREDNIAGAGGPSLRMQLHNSIQHVATLQLQAKRRDADVAAARAEAAALRALAPQLDAWVRTACLRVPSSNRIGHALLASNKWYLCPTEHNARVQCLQCNHELTSVTAMQGQSHVTQQVHASVHMIGEPQDKPNHAAEGERPPKSPRRATRQQAGTASGSLHTQRRVSTSSGSSDRMASCS